MLRPCSHFTNDVFCTMRAFLMDQSVPRTTGTAICGGGGVHSSSVGTPTAIGAVTHDRERCCPSGRPGHTVGRGDQQADLHRQRARSHRRDNAPNPADRYEVNCAASRIRPRKDGAQLQYRTAVAWAAGWRRPATQPSATAAPIFGRQWSPVGGST